MKLLSTLLLTASLASAGYPPPPGPWTLGAWRPPTDNTSPMWFGRAIQANGSRFWLGKTPSAYCPAGISGLDCSLYPGDSTVFNGGNDTVFLNVAVPGGQQVYIAPDGALGYTPPHSTFKPDGSIVSGWVREISVAGGAPTVMGYNGRPILACPAGDGAVDVYQIYVKLAEADPKSGCISFQMRTYSAAGTVAWEY
ncbi:hypothetical protein B0T17DRAFT_89882 [Bombardia bombarda]|uniref:Uncharacterized protein n=1 Tax=Bombardia bombarda TaxID=252184 RepID=A0AA39XNC8_9PEZI|nr:hypothetical protein B0T17DRAFT_89882 [Bombardia bombarda]